MYMYIYIYIANHVLASYNHNLNATHACLIVCDKDYTSIIANISYDNPSPGGSGG